MKKLYVGLIMIFILVILAGCDKKLDSTVKIGTYVMEQEDTEEILLPRVIISERNITFSHDLLSSYLPIGTYTVEEDILTMTTDDKEYIYTFRIDGDRLIFLEDQSSTIKKVNNAFGAVVSDQTKFILTEDK